MDSVNTLYRMLDDIKLTPERELKEHTGEKLNFFHYHHAYTLASPNFSPLFPK